MNQTIKDMLSSDNPDDRSLGVKMALRLGLEENLIKEGLIQVTTYVSSQDTLVTTGDKYVFMCYFGMLIAIHKTDYNKEKR